jgi:hypothetical protein
MCVGPWQQMESGSLFRSIGLHDMPHEQMNGLALNADRGP